MRLDLIDEFRLDLHPYVAGEGTRLFDDLPRSYRLDLVSNTEFGNGTVGLHYRRHRQSGARHADPCVDNARRTGPSRRQASGLALSDVTIRPPGRDLSIRRQLPKSPPKRGVSYRVEMEGFWYSGRPGDLRVMVAVDDGGFSAFRPLTVPFIVRPDGTFVGR